MTWRYKLTDAGNLSIYDHNGDHITTLMNDGSGFEIPGDIEDVMRQEWEASANLGESPVMDIYAGEVLMRMATGDIEEDPTL